jgi:hypothetical protein
LRAQVRADRAGAIYTDFHRTLPVLITNSVGPDGTVNPASGDADIAARAAMPWILVHAVRSATVSTSHAGIRMKPFLLTSCA